MKFLDKPLHIIKDNLLTVPPLFQTIKDTTETTWKEMYEVFNCGHRLEIYCPASVADDLIAISKSFNIDAQVVGKCTPSAEKMLTIDGIDY
jgi:phosphoribosylformylglycinamidine cyclo-ligase